MTLDNRTNERIPLSLHEPLQGSNPVGDYFHEAELDVDADWDSSFTRNRWVHIAITDEAHDSDRIKLTYEEAGLLHDRLGLILGRTGLDDRTINVPIAVYDEIVTANFDNFGNLLPGSPISEAGSNEARDRGRLTFTEPSVLVAWARETLGVKLAPWQERAAVAYARSTEVPA